jgi:hypothetical protein
MAEDVNGKLVARIHYDSDYSYVKMKHAMCKPVFNF